MIYRFFNSNLRAILGTGYPYYLTPEGKIVVIEPCLYKKEPSYDVKIPDNIGYHRCSGVKDQKGQMIYEGDIVSFGTDNKATVIFSSGCFLAKEEHSDKPVPLFKILKNNPTVTGNIIESPPNKKKKATVLPDFDKMNKVSKKGKKNDSE